MTNATYSLVSDIAQSMWKKSTARIVVACAIRNARQLSSRLAGGGNRRERRILRIVPAPTRWPRRRSSPWIRTTPQRVLSLASLTIRSANSPASGGRPGALGWVHFLVTRRRCQRSRVPGVTIRRLRSTVGRIRASAASSARSVQSIFGLGLPRRSTATSCRRTRISASFDADDRADKASHDSNVVKER
jgi:hypothetical protein